MAGEKGVWGMSGLEERWHRMKTKNLQLNHLLENFSWHFRGMRNE